jgi:hypothetical protein
MSDKPICFLAIPCGSTEHAKRDYLGWRTEVYAPVLARYHLEVGEESAHPVTISTQILRALSTAPMAIFDLGGLEGDVANPNVMYELGVRHALRRPAIVYSGGLKLPFDIAGYRAISEPRSFFHAQDIREQLANALLAAEAGNFADPFAEVGVAQLIKEKAGSDTAIQLLNDRVSTLVDQVQMLASQQGRIASAAEYRAMQDIYFRQATIDQLAPQKGLVQNRLVDLMRIGQPEDDGSGKSGTVLNVEPPQSG